MSEGSVVAIIVAFIVAVPPTLVAMLSARKVDRLHVLVNSNLGKQIAAEVAAAVAESQAATAFAEGKLEGMRLERARNGGARA